MNCYRPARHYLPAAAVAFGLALFSVWCGWNWMPALLPAFLLLLSSALLAFLASRPPITIRENSWSIGDRSYSWSEVERLDSTAWRNSPLILKITLRQNRVVHIVYPGEPEAAGRLLRQMRRLARGARIEGLPYNQYWGEAPISAAEERSAETPRYRLLRAEDEAEVERLFQQLKSAGRLDHQTSEERRD
jgi:hypothetical protein